MIELGTSGSEAGASGTAGGSASSGHGRNGRERILAAAVALFAENGYAATSIGQICSDAGVKRTALYWHYDSKEGLFETVLESLNERWIDELRGGAEASANAGTNGIDLLNTLLDQWRRLVIEQSPMLRLPLLAALELSDHSSRMRDAVVSIWEKSTKALAEGIGESLHMPPDRFTTVANVAIALLESAMVRFAVDADASVLDRHLSEIRHVVVTLIVAELAQDGSPS